MPVLENAHALIVGIAAYQNVRSLPPTVVKDACDVRDLLVDPEHAGYLPENVRLLIDGQATGSALRAALAGLAGTAKAESSVLFYFSSHGAQIASGPYAGEYLLPVDVSNASEQDLAATAISGAEFSAALRAIPARKVLVLFDCCHAGGIGQPKDALAPEPKTGLPAGFYEELAQGRGRAILASSRAGEVSWVLPGAENSLFTQHLLAGLRGGIASDDGLIRVFDLFEYLQPRVTAAQPQQHPIFKAELEDNFPVALYLGGQRGTMPRSDDGYRYDAYISYVDREPDAGWVWDTLVPRLEAAGLQVAVSGDVEEPGVARVVNIERGIRESRRTVVVLSDLYLADQAAGFENIVAQTMGLQEGTWRLLPVRRGEIDPAHLPVRLSMLTALDLSHPRRAEREFERLVRALQGPVPRG